MRVKRVNHTGISVSDMDRSLEFYCGLLGLTLVMDLDVSGSEGLDAVVGMPHTVGRVVMLGAGESLVELWCYAQPLGRDVPADYVPADRGVTHVALEVDDVDLVYHTISSAGYRCNSAPIDLGIHKTFYARGPDDEIIELLEDRSDLAMMARITERTLAKRRAAAHTCKEEKEMTTK